MISERMTDALNAQIALEAKASFIYLSMSSWCDKEGLEGAAAFLRRQSAEESDHMLRIFDYLSEVDAYALVPAIEQPSSEYESIQSVFEAVYMHEQKVTKSINDLMIIADEEKDFTTLNFLQWYIEEQREEESLMRSIQDKIKLIGNGPSSLYYIDKEIEQINIAQAKAAASEGA